MSTKTEPKRKLFRVKDEISAEKLARREQNNAHADGAIKDAAGQVQEELTPMRRSAGHAHTH